MIRVLAALSMNPLIDFDLIVEDILHHVRFTTITPHSSGQEEIQKSDCFCSESLDDDFNSKIVSCVAHYFSSNQLITEDF